VQDEPTWIPTPQFITIYTRRRAHLAGLGIDVSGLDAALTAAPQLTAVGVIVDDAEGFARFVALDSSGLGRVRLPSKER
jgi:hypothetical protein